MIFLDGTSGFHYGQVLLVFYLSVGQVNFLTKFEPWCMLSNTSLLIQVYIKVIIYNKIIIKLKYNIFIVPYSVLYGTVHHLFLELLKYILI